MLRTRMESSDRTKQTGTRVTARPAGSTSTAALAHPLRVRILALANEQDISPAEFCREGFAPENMDVSHVARHFQELAEDGCLEIVEESKRRGPIEQVYRGLARVYFGEADWHALSQEERERISRTVAQGLFARTDEAMMAGAFDSREDRHLSWIAMRLDEQGWKEMTTALAAVFGEVEQIRQDAEKRLADDIDAGFTTTCGILGFESPTVPRADAARRIAP